MGEECSGDGDGRPVVAAATPRRVYFNEVLESFGGAGGGPGRYHLLIYLLLAINYIPLAFNHHHRLRRGQSRISLLGIDTCVIQEEWACSSPHYI